MSTDLSNVISPYSMQLLGLTKPVTVYQLREQVERAEFRTERLRRLLSSNSIEANNLGPQHRRRYERTIDQIERATQEIERLIGGGSCVGGTRGDSPVASEMTTFGQYGLKKCRRGCGELISREDDYEFAGMCERCFTIATTQVDPEPWRGDRNHEQEGF